MNNTIQINNHNTPEMTTKRHECDTPTAADAPEIATKRHKCDTLAAAETFVGLEQKDDGDEHVHTFFVWDPSQDPYRVVDVSSVYLALDLLAAIATTDDDKYIHVFRLGREVKGVPLPFDSTTAQLYACPVELVDLDHVDIMVRLLGVSEDMEDTVDLDQYITDCRPFACLCAYFGCPVHLLQYFLTVEFAQRLHPLSMASSYDALEQHGVNCKVPFNSGSMGMLVACIQGTSDPYQLDSLARMLVRIGHSSTLMAPELYTDPTPLHTLLGIPQDVVNELDPTSCIITGGAAVFAARPPQHNDNKKRKWPTLLAGSDVDLFVFGDQALDKIQSMTKILLLCGYVIHTKGPSVATAVGVIGGEQRTIQLIHHSGSTMCEIMDSFDLHYCMVAHDGVQAYVTAGARGAIQSMSASVNMSKVVPRRFAKARLKGLRLAPEVLAFFRDNETGWSLTSADEELIITGANLTLEQDHTSMPSEYIATHHPVIDETNIELSPMVTGDEYRDGSMGVFRGTSLELVSMTKVIKDVILPRGCQIHLLSCPYSLQLPTMNMPFDHNPGITFDSPTFKPTNVFNKLQFIMEQQARAFDQDVVLPLIDAVHPDTTVVPDNRNLLRVCYDENTKWFRGGIELRVCPMILSGTRLKVLVVPNLLSHKSNTDISRVRFYMLRVCI